MMLTTADRTTESTGVKRRMGPDRNIIAAPVCIEKYNLAMDGVDRNDKLRSSFSLHKRHSFLRWYIQFYLCLFDIAITNANIHDGMKNPHMKNKKGAIAKFLQEIADTLMSEDTNWSSF